MCCNEGRRMSVIQKNHPLKHVTLDKDPLNYTLSLVHISNMNFNPSKISVVYTVSRIQANLTEWELPILWSVFWNMDSKNTIQKAEYISP